MGMFWLIITILVYCVGNGSCNLVQNPDFETANLTGLGVWVANGGKMAFNTIGVHGGRLSMKSYARHQTTDGIGQYVPLVEGSRYLLRVYVRQFNDIPRVLMDTYTATVTYTWTTNTQPEIYQIARQPYIQKATEWFLMETVFNVPDENFSLALLSVQGPPAGVEFLVDDFLLEEITEDKNWETEAYNRIREIRRNKIHFIFTPDPHMNPANITVKIDHKRHSFGFGTLAETLRDTNPKFRGYHHLLAANFNWATVPRLNWPASATNQCTFAVHPTVNCINGFTSDHRLHSSSINFDYTTAIMTALELKKNGVKVRAQSMFGNPPSWVQHLSKVSLDENIKERVQYMSNLTKGLVDQWDVIDNVLDNQLYEQHMDDPHYMRKLYQILQQSDPNVQYVMNEHDVITGGYLTRAYTDLADDLKSYGLTGIGATGETITSLPDPILLKMRLDHLGEAGLPVWITDLAVSDRDENIRASVLEKTLRFYFSHPSVEGVIFKDVWDRVNAPPYISLYNGDSYTCGDENRMHVSSSTSSSSFWIMAKDGRVKYKRIWIT